MKNEQLQKKAERRWLKKAGFGKDMKDLGALAVELGRARGEVPGGLPVSAGSKATSGYAVATSLRSSGKSGAAKRSLTDLCRECRELRDECKALRDEAARALESIGFLRRRMRRDLGRLAWFAGGLSLVNFAVAAWVVF